MPDEHSHQTPLPESSARRRVFQHQCAAMVAQMLAHTKDYTECEDRLCRILLEGVLEIHRPCT